MVVAGLIYNGSMETRKLAHLPFEKLDPLETPLCCDLRYRRMAGGSLNVGLGIGWSSRSVRFQGEVPLLPGEGLEIRLDAVRGLFPPLMVLAEVSGCREQVSGHYELSALVKGILTL